MKARALLLMFDSWHLLGSTLPPSSFLLYIWASLYGSQCLPSLAASEEVHRMPTLPPNHAHAEATPLPFSPAFSAQLGRQHYFPQKALMWVISLHILWAFNCQHPDTFWGRGCCSHAPWDNRKTISNVSSVPCHRKPETFCEGYYNEKDSVKFLTAFIAQSTLFIAVSNFCEHSWQGWYFCLPLTPSLLLFFPKKFLTQRSKNWLPDWYSH